MGRILTFAHCEQLEKVKYITKDDVKLGKYEDSECAHGLDEATVREDLFNFLKNICDDKKTEFTNKLQEEYFDDCGEFLKGYAKLMLNRDICEDPKKFRNKLRQAMNKHKIHPDKIVSRPELLKFKNASGIITDAIEYEKEKSRLEEISKVLLQLCEDIETFRKWQGDNDRTYIKSKILDNMYYVLWTSLGKECVALEDRVGWGRFIYRVQDVGGVLGAVDFPESDRTTFQGTKEVFKQAITGTISPGQTGGVTLTIDDVGDNCQIMFGVSSTDILTGKEDAAKSLIVTDKSGLGVRLPDISSTQNAKVCLTTKPRAGLKFAITVSESKGGYRTVKYECLSTGFTFSQHIGVTATYTLANGKPFVSNLKDEPLTIMMTLRDAKVSLTNARSTFRVDLKDNVEDKFFEKFGGVSGPLCITNSRRLMDRQDMTEDRIVGTKFPSFLPQMFENDDMQFTTV